MKLFVASTNDIYYISESNHNYCNLNELLIIPYLQKNEYSMLGMNCLKTTTKIKVKDLNISLDFLRELLQPVYEKLYNARIDKNGCFDINIVNTDFYLPANFFEDIDDLILKASYFNDGQELLLKGRTFYEKHL